jgi:mono/diheme cytochrome c family protein
MRFWATAAAAVLLGGSASSQETAVDFVRDVRPIFKEHCVSCHSAAKKKGSFRLDSRSAAMKGGMAGKAILPGKGAESALVKLLVDPDPDARMPQKAPALPKEKIEILRRWIDQGAPWPDSAAGEESAAAHWSYLKPVGRPTPAGRNPVDAILETAQKARGVTPRPEAPRTTLLRRVTIDLIGLPPTPGEIDAFLADGSPDAYERVVDRLLADPRHGERWGRHFMDVWRYSDWAGYQAEIRESQPHIWRWRDWIVESLNADKPYDRMVTEMLAGDELAPEDPATLRATGFLVRNWRRYSREVWLIETVEHTAKAFLATTMNCARCHDHFFDPISHEEYYAFRAFFEPHEVRTDHLEGGRFDVTKDGLPRVYDAKLDAATYRFERGDDRHPDKSKAIVPAAPRALGGSPLRIEPVTLPPWASAPEKRDFVRTLALAAADEAVADAVKALGKSEAVAGMDFSVAEARRALLVAQLQAERLEGTKDEVWKKAAEAAVEAQRRLALVEAARSKFAAKQKPDAKKLAEAEKALAKAEADLKEPAGTAYTPRKMASYPATSTGRRLALARWIASPENPLAARVLVNHVWLRHFGAPLVASTFDFGHNGSKPTHPELLDALAVEFMNNGWSLRKLHRLLVTSQAYRRDSSAAAAGPAKDPENKSFWRMNPRRMEAEAVRDSVLYLAGSLDPSRGGPELDQNSALTTARRSIYYRHANEKQAEFLTLFDAASVNECYERTESIVPQQALALANSVLVENQSKALAKKLPAGDGFVEASFRAVLGRPPSAAEREECAAFLRSAGDKGREGLVHVLFNHNDFLTIR